MRSKMSKEKERLISMLKEKKVSEADYKLLSAALDKKSIFLNMESSMLINPFQKIAGLKALLIGLVIMIMVSILGVIAKVYFDGILGYVLSLNIKAPLKPGFYLLLYQSVVSWLVLTLLFLVCALIFRKKRIRIIDFFGTVALARYPYLISVGYIAALQLFYPSIFNMNANTTTYEMHLTIAGTISNLVWNICYFWQLTTYFFALKEASGLEGKRLWSSYLVAILLGDIISMVLSRIFLYT